MSVKVEDIAARIAGSIVISNDPASMLKSWRERLEIRQIDLARAMGISPSVLSDYESGRRSSPGIGFVRRYVETLVSLDKTKKGILERFASPEDRSAILAIGEFTHSQRAKKIARLLDTRILEGEVYLDAPIYGYTVVDSIKTIYALSGFDFYRVFGATTERIIVFTKVGLGRSPLVAIRVSQLKPRMVVLHGPKMVDELALKLAKKERIILALSGLKSESDIIGTLKAL